VEGGNLTHLELAALAALAEVEMDWAMVVLLEQQTLVEVAEVGDIKMQAALAALGL
jgi:hypothetical protein